MFFFLKVVEAIGSTNLEEETTGRFDVQAQEKMGHTGPGETGSREKTVLVALDAWAGGGGGVWEDVWRVSLGFKEDLQGAQKRGTRWDINGHRNLDRGRNHAGQKVGLETETRVALRRDRL